MKWGWGMASNLGVLTSLMESFVQRYGLSCNVKFFSMKRWRAWHFICTGVLLTAIFQVCIAKIWDSPQQVVQNHRILRQQMADSPPSLLVAQMRQFNTGVYPRGHYGPLEGMQSMVLIVHVQHGLSNRLRALLWGRALAEVTARRFIVIWELDIHCNARYKDLFQRPIIDPFEVWDYLPPDLAVHGEFDIYNYMEPELGAKKYEYIDTNSPRDIYVRTAYALNCTPAIRPDVDIPSMFARLDLSKAVRAIVHKPAEIGALQPYMGVHIRHTNAKQDIDSQLSKEVYSFKSWSILRDARASAKPSAFILECKRILAQTPDLKVFVAADMEETAEEFRRELGSAVFQIRKPGCTSGVRSVRCVQFALADIFILSNSRFMLGSYWSSFTEVASYARQLAVRHAGVDFFGEYEDAPIECHRPDWVHPDAFRGVSIVNAVRSRNVMLARNLPSWLNVTGVDEILILDWDSTPPVEEITKPFNDKRIKVVRISNSTVGFWLSVGYNLAALHARGGRLLKVDADLQLPHDLVKRHPYVPGAFYAGNWRTVPTDEGHHLNGLIFAHRSDWARVNGYDERLVQYGYDDEDLYSRLETAEIRRLDANLTGVVHVSHSDTSRTNSRAKSGPKLEPHASTVLNELLVKRVGLWDREKVRARMECNRASAQVCDCALVETPTVIHDLVPATELDRLVVETKRVEVIAMTHWTWDQLLSVGSPEWLDHYYSLVDKKAPRALILQPLGCLADRLLAVAAAAGVAKLWHRPLTVVWIADRYCNAIIEDIVPTVGRDFRVLHAFESWEADGVVFELVDFVANIRARLPDSPEKAKHMLVRTAGKSGISALESALPDANPTPLVLNPGLELLAACPIYPVTRVKLGGSPGAQIRGLTDLWTLSEAMNRPLLLSSTSPAELSISEFVATPFTVVGEGLDDDASDERTYRTIGSRELDEYVSSDESLMFSYDGALSTPLVVHKQAARVAQRLTLKGIAEQELEALQSRGLNITVYLGQRSWDMVKDCYYAKAGDSLPNPKVPMLVVSAKKEFCENLPADCHCVVVAVGESQRALREAWGKAVAGLFHMSESGRLFWDAWTSDVEWAILRGDMPNNELTC